MKTEIEKHGKIYAVSFASACLMHPDKGEDEFVDEMLDAINEIRNSFPTFGWSGFHDHIVTVRNANGTFQSVYYYNLKVTCNDNRYLIVDAIIETFPSCKGFKFPDNSKIVKQNFFHIDKVVELFKFSEIAIT